MSVTKMSFLRAAALAALIPAAILAAPLSAQAGIYTFTGQVPGGADTLGGDYTIGPIGGGLVNFTESAGEQPNRSQQVLFDPSGSGLKDATSFTLTETGTLDKVLPLSAGFGNFFETFTPNSFFLNDWTATENAAGTSITYTAPVGEALLAGERFSTVTTFSNANTLPSGFAFTITWGGAAVPEPSTWALMISGVGLIGGSLRSRRRAGATAAA